MGYQYNTAQCWDANSNIQSVVYLESVMEQLSLIPQVGINDNHNRGVKADMENKDV